MSAFSRLRLAVLLSVVVGTVGCDQATKHFARAQLGAANVVSLPGGFGELRLAENPGSFLSLGAAFPEALRLIIFIIGAGAGVVILSAYLVRNAQASWLQFGGFALVAAGGMSNVIDRVTRHGLVTDFIFLQAGPWHTGIFNFADVMIMLGIAMLIGTVWQRRSPREQS
jgi:signal peptidase II